MGGIYILFGGIALFAVTVTLLDYLGHRQRRKSSKR